MVKSEPMVLTLLVLTSCLVISLFPSTPPVGFGGLGVSENLPWSDWSHYHNYAEIASTLLFLNETYPDLVDVFSIGQSWLNKTIYCVRLTNERISHSKPETLFVGYHHAREPITSELALYFLVSAVAEYGRDGTVTRMLDFSEIYVVVALNVDGYAALKENEWQRWNAHPYDEDLDGKLDEDPPDDEDGDGYIEDLYFNNDSHYEFIRWEGRDDDGDGFLNEDWVGGVDLNRNYAWNTIYAQGGPNPGDETYRGPRPFSEPETQALRDLILQHNFRYALSFHSGTLQVIGRRGLSTPDENAYRQVTLNLSMLTGAPCDRTAPAGFPTGMWEDYMYSTKGTIALTCEIYGNGSAWSTEPGPKPNTYWEKGVTQFFVPDPADIESVVMRWIPTFSYVTSRAINEAYDAAVTQIIPSKTAIGQGFSANIDVIIANQGMFTENLTLTLFANSTLMGTKAVVLPSRQTKGVAFSWNTTGFDVGNYDITARITQVMGETDMQDNSLRYSRIYVSLPGDIDKNNSVDLKDIYKIAVCFGANIGDLKYLENCDINGDGRINLLDLYSAALHFGIQG